MSDGIIKPSTEMVFTSLGFTTISGSLTLGSFGTLHPERDRSKDASRMTVIPRRTSEFDSCLDFPSLVGSGLSSFDPCNCMF